MLLGYDTGNPFAGNVLTTDSNGVTAQASAWTTPLPLTVQASGYVTTTLPSAIPGPLTVQISHRKVPVRSPLAPRRAIERLLIMAKSHLVWSFLH